MDRSRVRDFLTTMAALLVGYGVLIFGPRPVKAPALLAIFGVYLVVVVESARRQKWNVTRWVAALVGAALIAAVLGIAVSRVTHMHH